MQPSFNSQAKSGPSLKAVIIATLIVLVVLVSYLAYKASIFHIVSTNPKLSAVATASPYIKVNFNNALQKNSVQMNDNQNIVSGYTVSGKTLTINFASDLSADKSYVIEISHIENKQGEALDHLKLKFTAKDLPVDKLSAAAQKEIIARQDHYQYSVYSIPFDHFDTLTDNGISSDQLFVIKQAIYDFSVAQKVQFKHVSLLPSTIVPGAFDPNSDNSTRTLNFNMTVDGRGYRVVVSYDNIISADTAIYDSTGRQVYNSATTGELSE